MKRNLMTTTITYDIFNQLLKKIKSWGHSTDRDWESQIKEEFSRPFNGKDFIHNYNYNILS